MRDAAKGDDALQAATAQEALAVYKKAGQRFPVNAKEVLGIAAAGVVGGASAGAIVSHVGEKKAELESLNANLKAQAQDSHDESLENLD